MQIEQLPQQYRFDFKQDKSWKKYLEKYGFVVIANYLNNQLCQHYVSEFWSIMQFLAQGKLSRNDIKTQKLGKNYPPVLHGGMIQYIAHSKIQWQLRVRAKQLFAKVWNTQKLKSSYDGFCFMNGRRNYKPRQHNSFLHCDQSPRQNKIWSYQGIQTLTDADQNGGGFVCVPGSNKYHRQYFKKKNLLNMKQNWFIVPPQDKNQQPFINLLKVNTKAGDFILFDSRTFHCNTIPTTPTLRVCTYICMLPQDHVPEKTAQLRKLGVQKKKTSNHHPGNGFKTFPVLPRYLDNPKQFKVLIDEVNTVKLTKQMLELI